ncbi:MAG: T9SS type A sorting domain-containing protein [Flavobacteriales bacterium]|nr:T9SS type A sorting domain-containing protein [Flavobacteriales bacterium]
MIRLSTFRSILHSALAFLLLAMLPTAARAGGECIAQAGSTYMDYGPICLSGGHATITGTPQGDAVVPPGFVTAYVLSRTNGLILEQVGNSPSFDVVTADVWRIHTLVYNPNTFDFSTVQLGTTTAFDLHGQLVQGGGDICASLSFYVGGSKTMECEEPCTAFAPHLSMDSTLICIGNGEATLSAVVDGPGIVPPGFELRYLLSRTNGLILEQISTSPTFIVNSVDVWRIHSFVYDPSTFDIGSITLGSSSIYDLNPQLLQGGGALCASLLLDAAFVKTGECGPDCIASAGTTGTDQPDLCLAEGQAQLTATPDGSAIVPAGFTLAYVLTSGNSAVIQAFSDSPQFTVEVPGEYDIHAFVYNPGTFDPAASIQLGWDGLADLHAMLLQGGGSICASLDLVGTAFQVVDCTPDCTADAGSMLDTNPFACLQGGAATITAISFGDTLVPPGFAMGYLLSQGPGLVLMALANVPVFTVNDPDVFHIHAFVYDPATLADLGLEWGVTTVIELHDLLVQGGGNHCAGLDVLGATITVEDCPPPCDAGTDSTITVCLQDPAFAMFDFLGGSPCPGGTWTNPANPQVDGMFNPASDVAGVYTYTVADASGMTYSAHLTINVFECPGVTAGLNDARDGTATGIACPPDLQGRNQLSVWPNPTTGPVHITLPFVPGLGTALELIDQAGRAIPLPAYARTGQEVMLDARHLATGVWTVRITHGLTVYWGRFVR